MEPYNRFLSKKAVGLVLLRFVKITGEHHGGARCGVLFLYCIIS